MTARFDGKVAFVTGAARGQGRSHALRLAEEGADIIALDIGDDIETVPYEGATAEDLDETVDKIKGLGRRVVAARADVRDHDAVVKLVDDGVSELGRLDVVSANAGIFVFGPPTHEVSEPEWNDVIDINLTGVWHTVKAAVPHMIDAGNGGSIIITSSTAGLNGFMNFAAYTASKHAVIGLMRTLALELGEHDIRVNTIHPSAVGTDMVFNDATYRLFRPDLDEPTVEHFGEAMQEMHALPVQWVESADITNALLFLASDEARYITGARLPVDAGFDIKK